MAQDWKCCLFLLTFFVGLTLSLPQTEKGLEYYFYSPLGQKSSEEFLLRVKRDDDNTNEIKQKDGNPADSADSVPSLVTSETTPSNSSKTNITTTNSTDQKSVAEKAGTIPELDKDRGYVPPENETSVIKPFDEANLKELDDASFDAKFDISDDSAKDIANKHGYGEAFRNETDHHKYYSSKKVHFESAWIDLEKWNKSESHPGIVQEHSMLSKSYRRAATISLKFQFPFYGHNVKNITIATGGFLYTGEYVHSWLAATQYIAPLMANFDTSQEDNATVKYADNGTTLVVEWGNVYLQGRDNKQKTEGPFTFQAILHHNGDIIFAYKTIPIDIVHIADEEHPVKVGLSDAYIIERTIFFVRRKTIYEYHRVNMKDQNIKNNTAIHLKALPRCNMMKTCKECLNMTEIKEDDEGSSDGDQCMWCSSANLCSDGLDRNKQDWLKKNCERKQNHVGGDPHLPDKIEVCDNAADRFNPDQYHPSYKTEDHSGNDHISDYNSDSIGHNEESDHFKDSKSNVHHTGVALLTIVIILIITIFGWCLYAYFFPHTCSGQLLIKYRPSRWHWRRGEPRYTAASIHM